MIDFINVNAEDILNDMIKSVQEKTKEEIKDGDERNLFIHALAPIVIGIASNINVTANQNLLRYATKDKLDGLTKDIYRTTRQEATKASCKGKIKLSIAQDKDITVKAGTKVTPDGEKMFEVKFDTVIPKGILEVDATIIAVEPGVKYNGYEPGKINYIVDPIPYVEKIYNTEVSKSGSDIEDDDSFRERTRLSMESLSTAGPEGAYEYFALSADNSITTVKVDSPSPGVIEIVVAVDNGEIPSQDILDKVLKECNVKDRRPLTDNVTVVAPEVANYNIQLTYYLDKNFQVEEGTWRRAIEGKNLDYSDGAIREFIKWQQEDIGKAINPDELKYQIQNSAAYEVNGRKISGVRRIEVTEPIHTNIGKKKLAKVGTITVTYGGME